MKNQKANIAGLVQHLRKQGAVMLLESQMKNHAASTVSYLAAKPKAWIRASGNKVSVWEEGVEKKFEANPWRVLADFNARNKDWLFGYLGYDLKNHIEDLSSHNKALTDSPDLYFMIPELILEIGGDAQIHAIKGDFPDKVEVSTNESKLEIKLKNRIQKEDYLNLVQKAKQDIFEGSYYEINLSHPLEFELKGDSWNLYEAMKKIGPVPFGAYIEMDDLAICCSSPERFLARKGQRVWSQPIKGTALRKEKSDSVIDIERLKESEKERAENLMIVDLVRNDLSRIAIKNTVKVSSLFEIQSFETVHQMVSTVECGVEQHAESVSVIKACFPMGSMTGAPKIAAMKAIEEYENYKRGIYSGAIGYIKPNGDFDFNVVIRTAIIEDEKLIYPVGGAITSDSDPQAEWEETLIKARAMTNIFQKPEKPE